MSLEMIDASLRDRFHDLINQVGLISVKAQEFSLLYGTDIKEIDSSTKNMLFDSLKEMESYHSKAISAIGSLSKTLIKTRIQKDWISAERQIEGYLKDIKAMLVSVKNEANRISDANFKEDILKMAINMKEFVNKTNSIDKIISEIREQLISLRIYDNIYDDSGRVFIRVLICDGDPSVNEFIKEYFGRKEFIPYTAQNSEEALRIVRNKRPLVAFLDIKLETEEAGLNLIKEIREGYPATKIVMVTTLGVDDIKKILKAQNLNADYYFTKPVKESELAEKARSLVA